MTKAYSLGLRERIARFIEVVGHDMRRRRTSVFRFPSW